MKNFITNVLIFATSFLNGMSESLQREIADAEDSLELLSSKITEEEVDQVIKQFECAQKQVKEDYPRGVFTAKTRQEIARMLNLEIDLRFLRECRDYLLGGEETEAVKLWWSTAYKYQLILSKAIRRGE